MRILLATYWYLPHVGGVSLHVFSLKKELERLGHEVDILAHHPDMKKYYMPNNGRFLDKSKVKDPIYEKVLAYYNKNLSQVDPWIYWRDIERYSFEAAASVFGLAKYDLIHTHDIISTRALWRVKPKETPLIATIHGCLATELIVAGDIKEKEGLKWDYVSAEEYYGATSSDATILPSHWLKNLLTNEFKIPSNHLTVIPYGLDIESFRQKIDKYPNLERPAGKKVIICPARLVPVKGHKYLIDALAKLKQERSDWHCWIIGDGPLRQTLEQQVSQANLSSDITFLGNREDVPTLLNQSDIFVLPSLQDNLPFSIMEAQLSSKPIISTNAGGIPEMVDHGKNGLIVPAGESQPLYQSLKLMLENEGLRNQLKKNSIRLAAEKWSLQKMMGSLLDIYKKAVRRNYH
ncbi:glycosyltransferase family 4 protein [Bacillus massiliglaciei]|uniref:glycosyltransferase family 4 protein n=1 Tax=Bacillus massiliglaciei TaxID=1816693 RepID=UPI000ACC3612|nr:glycosyltransferase family 4 protein [Bacillus massiliglaciei]